MSHTAICELCKKEIPFDRPGAPPYWTFLSFCTIACLTEWKRQRFTANAFKHDPPWRLQPFVEWLRAMSRDNRAAVHHAAPYQASKLFDDALTADNLRELLEETLKSWDSVGTPPGPDSE